MGKQWKQWQTLGFRVPKPADSDCSHEFRRCLLLGRKAMTNLDSVLKSKNIILPTKVCRVMAMVFPVVMYECESWTLRRQSAEELMFSNCDTGEDSWESLGHQGGHTSQSWGKSTLNIHLKDWYWSYISNTLATWCGESTPWKTLWYWGRWRSGGKGNDRRWDGLMASLTKWTWIWANSGRQWRTGKPGGLQSTGSQRVGHELSNWTTTKRSAIHDKLSVNVPCVFDRISVLYQDTSFCAFLFYFFFFSVHF